MLTDEDLVWLLKKLPKDILRDIIANYNPSCFFIMDMAWLLDYDWGQQCKLTFDLNCPDYGLREYYNLCQRTSLNDVGLDGVLMMCGNNTSGQLGASCGTVVKLFETIKDLRVAQVACGRRQTYIILTDGTMMSTGDNFFGQLGRTAYESIMTFKTIPELKNIMRVSTGEDHVIVMDSNQRLLGCGYNINGELGLGDTATKDRFEEIKYAPKSIAKIFTGHDHTILLCDDGVYVCGYNYYGQLGLGDFKSRFEFTKVDLPKDIIQVSCGSYHSFILRSDYSVLACGFNHYGQLGIGHYNNCDVFVNIPVTGIQIACGTSHTFILRHDGTLMCCGFNRYGALGLGDTTDRFEFTQVPDLPRDIVKIECGYYHTIIMRANGMLMASGLNSCGQLGLGDTVDRLVFTEIKDLTRDIVQISCGGSHSAIITL